MSFLTASEGKTYGEFCEAYSIWDFGENHMAERKGYYPHDNYISNNLKPEGYEKMRSALLAYVSQLDYEQDSGLGGR